MVGADLLAILDDDERDKANKVVRLIARASYNPKLSHKDILLMPYAEFVALIKGAGELYSVPEEFAFLGQE